MPLVLTTNDVVMNPDHAWNDIEGVQYHYPNQYRRKIQPGEDFVYYRGVHRADGRRAEAEYFGRGRIGAVRPDPATEGHSRPSWFCAIEDYVPFTPPVPAKPDGEFYENIPSNMWRNGVRDLDAATYARIVAAAGFGEGLTLRPATPMPLTSPLREAGDLIIPRGRSVGAAAGGGSWRKSKQAKLVGDWAESAALNFIRAQLQPSALIHRAAQRETPGWDIDYVDAAGVLHRVEVKGTVGAAFSSIDLTIGELRAAEEHGEQFWIYLVAKCLTDRPRLQRIRNPARRLQCGDWTAKPTLFSIALG